MVGVARGVTDHVWCCYIAELAVVASAQGLGSGQELLAETRHLVGPQVSLILVCVPNVFWHRRALQPVSDSLMVGNDPRY